MADGQILVDDVAMETARNLLVEASTKLSLAKDHYASEKLSGTDLVVECEKAIDEVSGAARAAMEILTGIDASFENLDTFDVTAGTNPESEMVECSFVPTDNQGIEEWTEESIAEYEKGIETKLEIINPTLKVLEEDINNKEDAFNTKVDEIFMEKGLTDCFGYHTPEDFEGYVWSWIYNGHMGQFVDENGEYSEEKAAAYVQSRVGEFTQVLDEASNATNGKSYAEYTKELNQEKVILEEGRASIYALEQDIKEIPYLEISITDEYKEYAKEHGSFGTFDWHGGKFKGWGLDFYKNENGEMIPCDLTLEQYTMLVYLYENEGEGSARTYLLAIADSINQSKGKREADEVIKQCTNEDGTIDFEAVAKIWFEGFEDGATNFVDGLLSCLDFSGEGHKSATQYKQMFIMQTLIEGGYDILKHAYNNGAAIGNMAIPILVSILTGGGAAGSILMGFSAGGNAKNQALIEGYPVLSAYIYGALTGVSETVLERFLGSIPFISKSKVGSYLIQMLQEGREEFVQTWVDYGFKAILFGEEIDIDEATEEAFVSFVMGAIVSGELNGLSTVAQQTLQFVYNGCHVELNLSEIAEYVEAHPEMKVQDAIQIFWKEKAQGAVQSNDVVNVDTDMVTSTETNANTNTNPIIRAYKFVAQTIKAITGIDQAVLRKSIDSTQNLGKLLQFLEQRYTRFENDFKEGTGIFHLDSALLHLRHYLVDTEWIARVKNFFEGYREMLPPKIYNEAIYLLDMAELKNLIIQYGCSKTGLSQKDMCDFFYFLNGVSVYDGKKIALGQCSLATFAGMIFEQLSPEIFRKSFGFDKYIECGNTQIYNPLLFVDILISVYQDQIVEIDGKKFITNPKNFPQKTLSTSNGIAEKRMANYLAAHGLELKCFVPFQLRGDLDNLKTNTNNDYKNANEYFEKFIDIAEEVKASIWLEFEKGVTIMREDGSITQLGGPHAVNCTGKNSIGYTFVTWAQSAVVPFGECKVMDLKYDTKTPNPKGFSFGYGAYIISPTKTGIQRKIAGIRDDYIRKKFKAIPQTLGKDYRYNAQNPLPYGAETVIDPYGMSSKVPISRTEDIID